MSEKISKSFKRNYYTSDDSGKMTLFAVLAPFIVLFLFYWLGTMICEAAGLNSQDLSSYLWFVIPYSLLGQLTFFFVYIIYHKACKISYNAVGIRKLNFKHVLICITLGIVMLFGLNYFTGAIDFTLKAIGYPINEGLTSLPLTNVGWLILNIIVLAVLPAICEELIFRGVVLSGLRSTFGQWGAILLSSVMFALMHASIQQFVYQLILGIVLCLVVIRTGSLLSSMIIHFTNNAILIVMAYIQVKTGFSIGLSYNNWWVWILTIALAAITGIIVYVIDRFYFKRKVAVEPQKIDKQPSKYLWISLFVEIFLLIFSVVLEI